jgi:hypothetical protein
MPQPVQAPSMEIMEPFNIPTSVNAPVRQAPHMNLTFPVFTPPAASSYGTTTPIEVPWHPPDLAGALNAGLQTGAHLATSFMQNKKTAQEVNAEEQALKLATAAAADPARRAQMGFQFGAGGATATLPSALDYYTKQAELAKTQQETAEARARTGTITPESAAKIAEQQAKTKQTEVQTGLLGINEAQRRHNQITSGFTNQPPPDQSTAPDQSNAPTRDYTGVDYTQ